jgi:hypothetical protein
MSQQANTAEAPTKTSILTKVAIVWAAIAALVPTVIGVIMLRTPQRVMTPGTTVAETFATMAYRNFGFSAVLALALFTQPRNVVAFLLLARGLTEWADGLSGVFIARDAWLMPAIGGLGDLVFAYVLYRSQRR